MKNLSRDQIKKIFGGNQTCVDHSCGYTDPYSNVITPPPGACSVTGGPFRCCWAYC